jgi:hypothetical protein
MVLIQGLFATVFRSLGKLLNTAFGWATTMLFGKVSEDRQIYLSVISFGSVAWLVALVGVIVPSVGTFLLGLVKLPSWVDQNWIRLAMLAAAVVLPAVIGVVALLMMEPEERPYGAAGKAKAVLKGYPYTLGMAITLVMMTAIAPVLKVRDLVRRWTSTHVPVMVEPDDYLSVVGDVQQALLQGGLATQRAPASWMLRAPTKVLTLFAGKSVSNLVADQLTTLKSEKVEVLLHPSDMVISGQKLDAARAHAIITEQLTFTAAYMTWDKEANHLEDRLRATWQLLREQPDGTIAGEAMGWLRGIERDLHQQDLPYEEWEVLFREKMQVERGILQMMAGITDRPRDLTEGAPDTAADAETAGAAQAGYDTSGTRSAASRPASQQPKPAYVLALGNVAAAIGAVVGVAVALARRPWRKGKDRGRHMARA